MKAGLIGEKLTHSFSPIIHKKISELTGIKLSYELLETKKGQLKEMLKKLEENNFSGANVTIPYKTDIMQHIGTISEEASAIGAVNTVRFKNGKRYGYNTDYYGLKVLLEKHGAEVAGKSIVILGTGGAAKCAGRLLKDLGAGEVIFASRELGGAGRHNTVSYEELESMPAVDMVINATPVGMFPDTGGCPLSDKALSRCGTVVDMIYNPPATRLMSKARKRGIYASGGLWMLCAQAVRAEEIWNESTFGPDIYGSLYAFMRRSTENANIVLIGMPGSGKTTAGKRAAEKLGMPFSDTDDIVERRYGNIPDIFKTHGEEVFRRYEQEAANIAADMKNTVISTGGGMILNRSNIEALKSTGIIAYINMPLDKLLKNAQTCGRPLLADGKEAIKKLYEERSPLYEAYADITIDNSKDIEYCVQDLLKKVL